jgi:rhodanese-related sulfurtransferase
MRISHLNRHFMLGLLVSVFAILLSLPTSASEVSIISSIQLKRILDNPEIVIIDVRSSKDWRSSNIKIKGAVRKLPKSFESWAHDFSTDKELILY